MWRPFWETHGSSFRVVCRVQLADRRPATRRTERSRRSGWPRTDPTFAPRVSRRDANNSARPSENSAGSVSCQAEPSAVISAALCHAADASGRIGGEQMRGPTPSRARREHQVELPSIQRRRLVQRRRAEAADARRRRPRRVAGPSLRDVEPPPVTPAIAGQVHGEAIDRDLGILVVLRAGELGHLRVGPHGSPRPRSCD